MATTIKLDFRNASSGVLPGYNALLGPGSLGVKIADLLDDGGALTGVSFTNNDANGSAGSNSNLTDQAWEDIGSAAWDTWWSSSNGGTLSFTLKGLPVGQPYSLNIAGLILSTTRDVDFSDGTTVKTYENNSASQPVTPLASINYSGTVPGNGELTITATKAAVGGQYYGVFSWATIVLGAAGPTLSLPTGTKTGSTTADGTVSTTGTDGTLHYFASVNSSESITDIKANATNQSVSGSGVQPTIAVTGLTSGTTYYMHYVHTSAAANDSAVVTSATFDTDAAADTTAPILSNVSTVVIVSDTSITGSVDTDDNIGLLSYRVTVNATETIAFVEAGSSQAVIASGTQNIAQSGLTAGQSYYLHFTHEDLDTNESAVVTSAQFTMTGGGDVTAPVISNEASAAVSDVAASVSIDTDEANGFIHTLVSIDAVELLADIVANGVAFDVTATGTQALPNATGLTADTTYYAHYVHRDDAGNDSNVIVSPTFTTQGPNPIVVADLGYWTNNASDAEFTTPTDTVGYHHAGVNERLLAGASDVLTMLWIRAGIADGVASTAGEVRVSAINRSDITIQFSQVITIPADTPPDTAISQAINWQLTEGVTYQFVVADNVGSTPITYGADNSSNAMTSGSNFTLGDNYTFGGTSANSMVQVAASLSTAVKPVITSPTATYIPGGSYTVTGTNFGGAQGTFLLGGVAQTITAWSDTSVTFTMVAGDLKYGAHNIVLSDSNTLASLPLSITFNPVATLKYVNVGGALVQKSQRIDTGQSFVIVNPDQIEYTHLNNTIEVLADGSILVNDGVTFPQSVVWRVNDGVWGSTTTLTVNNGPTVVINSPIIGTTTADHTAQISKTGTLFWRLYLSTIQPNDATIKLATNAIVANSQAGLAAYTDRVVALTGLSTGESYVLYVYTNDGTSDSPILATSFTTANINAAPIVTGSPSNATIAQGSGQVTLIASASGVPTPTAQWQKDTKGDGNFVNIAGATGNALTILGSSVTQAADDGTRYRAVYSNVVSTATTVPATLTVIADSNSAPVITTSPSNTVLSEGQGSAVFTAAASGVPTPTVQWQKDIKGDGFFNDIAGATSDTLVIDGTSVTFANDNGNRYRPVYTNSVQSTTGLPAILVVNEVGTSVSATLSGRLVDWKTGGAFASKSGIKISASTLFGGAAVASGVVSTDISGSYTVTLNGLVVGVTYFVQKESLDGTITSLVKQTAT